MHLFFAVHLILMLNTKGHFTAVLNKNCEQPHYVTMVNFIWTLAMILPTVKTRIQMYLIRNHSFSTYTKFSQKMFFTTWYTRVCAYQGVVRNFSLSENSVYVLNDWSLRNKWKSSEYNQECNLKNTSDGHTC